MPEFRAAYYFLITASYGVVDCLLFSLFALLRHLPCFNQKLRVATKKYHCRLDEPFVGASPQSVAIASFKVSCRSWPFLARGTTLPRSVSIASTSVGSVCTS